LFSPRLATRREHCSSPSSASCLKLEGISIQRILPSSILWRCEYHLKPRVEMCLPEGGILEACGLPLRSVDTQEEIESATMALSFNPLLRHTVAFSSNTHCHGGKSLRLRVYWSDHTSFQILTCLTCPGPLKSIFLFCWRQQCDIQQCVLSERLISLIIEVEHDQIFRN
jgi:hypothetical protein